MPSPLPLRRPRCNYTPHLKGKRNHRTELAKGFIWLTPDVKSDIQRLIYMTSQHSVGKLLGYTGNKSRAARTLVDGTRRQIRRDKYAKVQEELKKYSEPQPSNLTLQKNKGD